MTRRQADHCLRLLTLLLVVSFGSIHLSQNSLSAYGVAGDVAVVLKSKESVLAESHVAIVAQQIENFQKGTALLLNVHITHHGGTTFCREFGRRLKSPSFVCSKPTKGKHEVGGDYYAIQKQPPWKHDETAGNLAITQKYFQMISWEFSAPPGFSRVSSIVMKSPVSCITKQNKINKCRGSTSRR